MCFPFIRCLSKCFQTSLMWCTWVKTNTSAVTKMAFSGIAVMFSILLRKSLVSLIYYFPSCITGLRWWSKNSEIFSVGVPQFEITGFPGTSNNFLWILRSRCILPRLVVFLYLHVKYWSFFSDIIPLAFKYLKKWLLFLQFS